MTDGTGSTLQRWRKAGVSQDPYTLFQKNAFAAPNLARVVET